MAERRKPTAERVFRVNLRSKKRLSERNFIDFLRSVTQKNPSVSRGIGDDAAVLRLPSGHELLVTTDFTIEEVHFRRAWQSPECVGHRCLARGLSDIAAMGGAPIAAFLSVALPKDVPARWIERFLTGFRALASAHGIDLAGGDTSGSPSGVTADVIVVGTVPRGRSLLRSGARPGDLIYVSGELGEPAAALASLRDGTVKKKDVFPTPRLAVARHLRERRLATSAIDISDGLSTDLHHICEESRVGARIDAEAIPVHSTASLAQALHGGEDYELLFTAPKSACIPAKVAGVKISRIGEILKKPGMSLVRQGKATPLRPQGWQHLF